MSRKRSYRPKQKEERKLNLALAKFRRTNKYQDLPDEFKKHL